MNDFIVNVLKGLYPIYFCFLILGVTHRIRCKKWDAFDTLLLLSFLLFEFFTAFQISFFYGFLSTSKRYLWMGLPLSLPFAANGLLCLLKHSNSKIAFAALCLVLIGVNIYNAYSPILHERHSVRKSAERTISDDVASWIAKDWDNRQLQPVAVFKCDQYQSSKRPLVQSELPRIGWLCGGQNYPEFFAAKNIMPDYIVSYYPAETPDYELVHEIHQVHIYKNRKLRP